MAKIVFWSPEEGKSGCTHVAIAVRKLHLHIQCMMI